MTEKIFKLDWNYFKYVPLQRLIFVSILIFGVLILPDAAVNGGFKQSHLNFYLWPLWPAIILGSLLSYKKIRWKKEMKLILSEEDFRIKNGKLDQKFKFAEIKKLRAYIYRGETKYITLELKNRKRFDVWKKINITGFENMNEIFINIRKELKKKVVTERTFFLPAQFQIEYILFGTLLGFLFAFIYNSNINLRILNGLAAVLFLYSAALFLIAQPNHHNTGGKLKVLDWLLGGLFLVSGVGFTIATILNWQI